MKRTKAITKRLSELAQKACEQTPKKVLKHLYPNKEVIGIGEKKIIEDHLKYLTAEEQAEFLTLSKSKR